MKEAMFYQKLQDGKVRCVLCPHRCLISPGKRGICGVRENREGKLFSLVYGRIISWAVDPIEKKPLYHFLPGEGVFSIATVGCNLSCRNCQNYTISQVSKEEDKIQGEVISPQEIVQAAKKRGTRIIAYTYTEPTIFYELAYDTCRIASAEGIKNVFVTNGYIMPQPLKEVSSFLDAANVDLKSMKDETYKKVCGGRLQPVLDAIKLMKDLGIWVEVTTLVIPGINDSEDEIRSIANFIFDIDSDIPWHLSRFYPTYKMQDHPFTPVETLRKVREVGLEIGLKYVYIGNVSTEESEDTFCPNCKKRVIRRTGFYVSELNIKNGRCGWCGNKLAGVWE